MRPQDIEKIARSVAGGLVRAGEASVRAGCGALSSPEAYECLDFMCTADYECGDVGNFTCDQGIFFCETGFNCPANYTT